MVFLAKDEQIDIKGLDFMTVTDSEEICHGGWRITKNEGGGGV